jgi:hypothetical protein
MQLADFDFDLPEDRIALRPAHPRDAARLLLVDPGRPFEDLVVRDLPGRLRPGDLLVLNDTRVIPARLRGRRLRADSVVAVEATLHRRLSSSAWSAFMRPGKRLAVGDRVVFGEAADRACLLGRLEAVIKAKGEGGEVTLGFDLAGPDRLRRGGRVGGRAHRRPALHAGAVPGPGRAGSGDLFRHPARRRGHLPAGEDRAGGRAPHASGMGRGGRGRRRAGQRRARSRRSHRLRRHHLPAAPGVGRRRGRPHPAVPRRDRHLASSASAPPPCGSWSRPPARTAASGRSAARPPSSSPPATGSGQPTG